jgi:uncharacterized protein
MRRSIRRGRARVRGVVAAVFLAAGMIGLVAAQGGDQFLDGIGETSLVARYLFNGSAEDSSRNHLHASLQSSGAAFVDDERFGRVLELAGSGGYVQLPPNALTGEEALSIAAWPMSTTGPDAPVGR